METVLGSFCNISIQNFLVASINNQINYVFNHKQIVQSLMEDVNRLEDERTRVQHLVDAAIRRGERIYEEANSWLISVDREIGNIREIYCEEEYRTKLKCCVGACPNVNSRYHLSKKAAREAVAVAELLQSATTFCSVSFRPPLGEIMIAPSKSFEAFESRNMAMNGIMEALIDDNVGVIGVSGMVGVGKTELVRQVAKQVMEDRLFDCVILVTVGYQPDILHIQSQIADTLGLKFEEFSMAGRAARLRDRLKKEKRVLVILDNVLAWINLEEIGIPEFPHEHNGLKMLLTSRDVNLLWREMLHNEKIFRVNVLQEEESWNLLKKLAGLDTEESPELQSIAIKVAKMCGGLPVLITEVAKALKNKDLYVWKDALRQLEKLPRNATVSTDGHMPTEFTSDELENMFSCFKIY